jgi:hypothetical protein
MYGSDTLTNAGERWQRAADDLLSEAERIGPLDGGVFGDLSADDSEGAAAADRVDGRLAELIASGDEALRELVAVGGDTADVRYQATTLLVATLAVGDALAVASQSPSDPFGGLSVEAVQATTFADARSTVAEARAVVTVPKSLGESLEKIETAGATESFTVLSGSIGKLAGGALVSGLHGVLQGAAAAAFQSIEDALTRWVDVLKRGFVRIAKWVVDKVKELLPDAAAAKIDELVEELQKKLETGVADIATDLYGRLLGRGDAEEAWRIAAESGADLTAAEAALPDITAGTAGRIAWVTKGRTVVEKFDVVLAAAIGAAPAAGQLAFAALVAAVLGFVALQVWDGFNDIEALV